MNATVKRSAQFISQAFIYAGFAAFLGFFANAPTYTQVDSDQALIKLSFAYGAKAKGGCVKRTKEQLEELAPNMRKPEICARERLPVYVRLSIDDTVVVEEILPPTGLHSDGPSRIYEKLLIPSGSHNISIVLRDTTRDDGGFDYEAVRDINFKPGQSLAIDFHGGGDGFIFQ